MPVQPHPDSDHAAVAGRVRSRATASEDSLLFLSDLPDFFMAASLEGDKFRRSHADLWECHRVCMMEHGRRNTYAILVRCINSIILYNYNSFVSQLRPEMLEAWLEGEMRAGTPRPDLDAMLDVLHNVLEWLCDCGRLDHGFDLSKQRWVEVPDDYSGRPGDLPGNLKSPNPIAKARAYRSLMASAGLTGRGLARRLGVSQPSLAKAIRLLELPAPILHRVEAGRLAPSTALLIAAHPDPGRHAELLALADAGKLRRDDLRAEKRGGLCPVRLAERGQSPSVFGRAKAPISEAAYDAVKILVEAWPNRVPLRKLEAGRAAGGAGLGARRNLRALRHADPDWAAAIEMAGRAHKEYGITAATRPRSKSGVD